MLYSLELSPITYLAFCVLGVVFYLYFQQRREYQRHINAQSQASDQLTIAETKVLGASSPKLPTFSAQEVEQRKPAKEIDQTTLNPRNLQYFPEFGNRNALSGSYGTKIQSLGTTEKMFDGFRKSVPYDPVTRPTESSSVFAHLGRSETLTSYNVPETPKDNLGFHKRVSYIQKPSNETNIGESQYQHPISQTEGKDDRFLLEEKDDANIADQITLNKYGVDLDNEYKVFSQEFKQKEGKTFHEEGKRFDSPQRLGWGVSALDRVGHSPESPFKIFESPFVERESKKRLKSNESDHKLSKKQTGSLVKKDSISRVQEPLNQETRGREVNIPIQVKQSKLSAKLERRSKPGQIFMDVNSDDEMTIEKERESKSKYKRPGVSSQSMDNIEKEATTEKYFKDNNFAGKARISEEKSLAQNLGSLSPRNETKGASKRKSTVDIAYLSEMGGNLSMRRYIEKKTAQDNLIKSNKVSTAGSYQKNDFSNEPRSKSSLLLRQENSKDEQKPFTSLIQNTGFVNHKKSTNGGSFLFSKESKTLNNQKPIIPLKEDDEILEEKKPKVEIKSDETQETGQNEEKYIGKQSLSQTTIVNKIEAPKISNILGGSSIFSQTKPESNAANSLFSNKTEEPKNKNQTQDQLQEKSSLYKKEEVIEKENPSKELSIQQNPSGFDLFKTVRAGATFPKPEELNDKNKEIENSSPHILHREEKKQEDENQEEKKFQTNESSQEKKIGLFGTITNGDKNIQENILKNDSKAETKTLFGAPSSGGSPFSNLVKSNGTSVVNQDPSQFDDSKKVETTGTSLFGGFLKPNISSLPTQSSLFGAPSIKREDSKGSTESPKSNFLNKPADDKNALNTAGNIFGSAISQQKSTGQEGSLNNEKVSSPPSGSSLFGNSSSFSKTSFTKNDGPQKNDTPMFGSLKPIEGDSFKPTAGPFSNLGKSESGLFGGSTSLGGGSSHGGLWNQNLSVKNDLFKK